MRKTFITLSLAGLVLGATLPAMAQDRTPPDTSVKALEPPADQRHKQSTPDDPIARSRASTLPGETSGGPSGVKSPN